MRLGRLIFGSDYRAHKQRILYILTSMPFRATRDGFGEANHPAELIFRIHAAYSLLFEKPDFDQRAQDRLRDAQRREF